MSDEMREQAGLLTGPTEGVARRGLRHRWAVVRPAMPETETIILLGGLLLTVMTKLLVVRRSVATANPLVAFGDVAYGDLAVYLAAYALLSLCRLWKRGRPLRSLSMMAALTLAFWSVVDAVWLFSVGTQLRLEVLGSLVHDADYCWPIVLVRLKNRPFVAIAGGLVVGALGYWTVRSVLRGGPLLRDRRGCLRRVGIAAGFLAVGAGVQQLCQTRSGLGYTGMLVRSSSHLGVMRSLLASGWSGEPDDAGENERLLRAGQRSITVPDVDRATLPNVVIVMMESVAYWATTLGDPQRSTPVLAELATQGVEFTTTRAGVTITNKSIFASLTGVTGGIHPKKVEGVLVDPPYESLATMLGRCGYRAGFFEMARAESFYPAMLANLGFEQFWSRENLEDPSVNLTYAAGDDFLMLAPAFAWARERPAPYLLFLMTSVAHDPYTAPDWFGPTPESDPDRFVHCVEFTDAFLGGVLQAIEEQTSPRETLLCVISDHGEGFTFQHGVNGHLEVPFEETLRIPWIIRWPGRIPPGMRVDSPCSMLDVTPTLLALLGFGIDQAGFEGLNALGPIDPQRRLFFAGFGNGSPRGYVEGNFKYLYTPQARTVLRHDLVADPLEASPLTLDGAQADRVIATVQQWQDERDLHFAAGRFAQDVLFGHWAAWSSGRNSWAYYRP